MELIESILFNYHRSNVLPRNHATKLTQPNDTSRCPGRVSCILRNSQNQLKYISYLYSWYEFCAPIRGKS